MEQCDAPAIPPYSAQYTILTNRICIFLWLIVVGYFYFSGFDWACHGDTKGVLEKSKYILDWEAFICDLFKAWDFINAIKIGLRRLLIPKLSKK